MESTKVPNYIKTVYISLLIIIIIFFMIMAKPILVPLMVSAYIAMVLTSLCNRLERVKIPRSLTAFISLMLFIVLITAILYFIVTQLGRFTDDLQSGFQENLDRMIVNANNTVKRISGVELGMQYGFNSKKLIDFINSGNTNIRELLGKTLGTLSNMLLIPVFVFFLLIYRDHFAVFVTKVFRKESNEELLGHIVSIRKVVHAYLVGARKVMLILGIVNTIILLLLGVKHAIFFGMLAGFLNIIPYIGPLVGASLPFFFALLTKDSLFYPISIAVSFTVIQFLESAYLTPKITGANVSLNAFITFLGLLVGGAIWGIVGMILIIPTIAILKKLFELSPDTEPYAYLFGEENTRWFAKRNLKNQIPK